jgi:hypothetical protein
MVLSRANEESAMKSHRSNANWERKRKLLTTPASDGASLVMTRQVPAWLQVVGSGNSRKIVPVDSKVKNVKLIFSLAVSGYGLGLITRKLNREGVTPIGRGNRWHSTYIHDILHNRAVLGELSMRKLVDGKRTLIQQVKGYYPRIIDEKTFERANALLTHRRSRRYGGPVSKFCNIFNGLLYDGEGEPYTVYEKKSKFQRDNNSPYRCLVSLGALLGRQSNQINLRLAVFEAAFFDVMLKKFSPSFMRNTESSENREAEELQHRILDIDNKVLSIQEQVLKAGAEVGSVVKMLSKLEEARKLTERELQKLRVSAVVTDKDRLRNLVDIYCRLVDSGVDNDGRLELQSVLQQLLKRITLKLSRTDNVIEGTCIIEPTAGDDIWFRLTFHPYTNDRKAPLLSRSNWQVIHNQPLGAATRQKKTA